MEGGQLKTHSESEQYCRLNKSAAFADLRNLENVEQYTSRCLLGHSGVIEFLEVALEARLAATVENASQQPSIRIWKLPPFESDSEDVRCTALVGSDRLNRQQLQVWELHGLLTTGRPNLLARQVSDFQIETLRISPLEELRLVSCGKENIRFWRIKNGHLPGCNVTLDGLGRGNIFTDLAFVLPDQAMRSNPKGGMTSLAKLLASSTCGSLLEIDYFTRAVRRVFTLHQSSIWALSTGPGFCVTASADKTVKVWPLNFMAAYFSAVHSSECVGVETAPDGQQVLCTCGDSAVELLNLTTQQHLQTFEMESPQDPPLCVAAHPTQRALALGFRSGAVRVLAVEGPAVWMEANHHTHPVTAIWFVQSPEVATDLMESCTRHAVSLEPHNPQSSTHNRELLKAGNEVPGQGFLVISMDTSGCICIFSQLHEFALIRRLENPQIDKAPEGVPGLVFSGDGTKAVRYFSSRTLGFLRLPKFNFEAEFCPFPTACKSVVITTFSFSACGDALCVCGSDSRMRVFSIKSEGGSTSFRQTREIALLSGPISAAWISSAGLEESDIPPVGVTCGEDNLIKVWNLAKLNAAPGTEGNNRPDSTRWREADGATAASEGGGTHRDCSRSPTHNTAAFAAAGLTAEFPQYQSFAGHNRPPFMMQLMGDYLVTVSTTETITWRVGSPLLTAASDITPAGSIALLPPLEEGPPVADALPVDLPVPQQQESQQQTNCEQGKLPQPQQPPRAHPQPLKQPLGNAVSPVKAAQATVGPTAISSSSNGASLSQFPSANGPENSSPRCAVSPNSARVAPAAAKTIRAAGKVPSSAVANDLQGSAAATRSSPLAAAAAQRINAGGLTVPAATLLEDESEATSAAIVVDASNNTNNADQPQSKRSAEKGEVPQKAAAVPDVKVFPGAVGASIQLEASIHIGQQLTVTQQLQESSAHWGFRAEGAAARHVIGTAVASCRSSCLWRPLKGVLAHVVGNWVLIERLSTPAASHEGKCLGLLPALLGRPAHQRLQQHQIPSDSPRKKPSTLQRQQRGAQLLQHCATAAQNPRISVLRHPIVGPAIAFAIDTTARLAATISSMNFTIFPLFLRTAADSAGACGAQVTKCLGLCLWKAEGEGELLGAARLPQGYGEADDSFRLSRLSSTLGFLDRDAEDFRPGVLFCGSDLVVTAGGAEGSRLDIWRVSDFLPPGKYLGNSQRSNEPAVGASKTVGATVGSNYCPYESSGSSSDFNSSCSSYNKEVSSVFSRPMQYSTPAVGAEVGTPLRKLLSAASNDEREVVFVSLRSVTLWRIIPVDNTLPESCSNPNGLQLQFQHTKQPKRLLADPLENYTTACLTRRAKGSPRLLLVASDRVSSITCGKAMYLAYSSGCFTRRATVDLIRVLEMQQGLGPQSVDLRQQAALQPLALDAPIKSLQLDAEAQEAAVGPTATGGSKASRLQHFSRGSENRGDIDSPLIATADSEGCVKLWSRWPLPQQLADFSLPHPCTALAFLWRSLLLGCFKDGSLRLFDTNALRAVGRLQLATAEDPPVAIACLGDRHALLATASGELLSLVLDLRFKEKTEPSALCTPQIKHASVSKISNALTACFGPTFALQQPPAAAWDVACSSSCGGSCSSSSAPAAATAAAAARVTTAVDCLVAQRQTTGAQGGDSRIRFALCLMGGYCSVGAYSRSSPENNFGVRFGPEEGPAAAAAAAAAASQHALSVSHASFSGRSSLLVSRGVFVYWVDCEAQQVKRRIDVRGAAGILNSRALGRMAVAAICALREDSAIVVTEGGEALLLQLPGGSVAAVGHLGLHPNLPRICGVSGSGSGSWGDPLCLAAYGEEEVVVACGSALSVAHVF
ncbi:WD domain, G-beta repeat-containing protein, putative [Eimeria brunetti]|uniref:WD domain, G-beta repeat-containing protein, putative n=1 Tax=Eimeria brunetti TaxID=51314 RepID=U6LNH8_9EIME|nr:WD domain, G-beta repeat-containing protein, putative [Eimeria brunetti]